MDGTYGQELALRYKSKFDKDLIIHEKYQWKKLWGQKEATLVDTSQYYFTEAPACQDWHEYNQQLEDGRIIPLSEGVYFVLRFIGDKGIPFTIIRKQNYEAIKFYNAHIGQDFKIKVEKHG